jgi:acetyl-CoA acetyltransferase
VVLTSMDYARSHGLADPVRVKAISTVTPTFPNTVLDMPNLSTDPTGSAGEPDRTFKESIGDVAYEEAGIGPDDVDVAEVYDLSTALELDWIEDLSLCKRGEAEQLLRNGETTIGGRIPVNPSGGLACFGEAVPAQALAQVCELTWQLRGHAEGRQVEGARVGITANQGLFGHGSSVILSL